MGEVFFYLFLTYEFGVFVTTAAGVITAEHKEKDAKQASR